MLNDWSYVLNGNYLKTVEDTQNLTTRYKKDSRRGFQIISYNVHVQFERKISVSQSNLLYPCYGVYVYSDLKRQKLLKRVKMLTSKCHRKQEHFFIHPFRSFQCIWFVKKQFFCRKQRERVGRNFRLCPLLDPRAI